MGKILKETIHANGIDIGIYTEEYVIQNWMRSKSTVSFIGLWEVLHNPNFNCLEFEAIKSEAGEMRIRN